MRQDCLDIGIIQAFLDGETVPDHAVAISDHVAACDDCALLLANAEEENSFVFSALDREMNTLVPTQRLWSRINESIGSDRARLPFWERLFGFLSAQMLNPSLSAAAGVLLIVGIVAGVWSLRSVDEGRIAATNTQSSEAQIAPPKDEVVGKIGQPANAPDIVKTAAVEDTSSSFENAKPVNAAHRPNTPSSKRSNARNSDVRPITLQYIPGEESYIKTIEELKVSVESQKDHVLSPSTRVAFERDLAVVNDAIKRMQDVVRKDPGNQAARQVLYAAYQDKIDLLNSIGQREELLASLH